MRLRASRPESKMEGRSCLMAQTIQSITVLNCSAGILKRAFEKEISLEEYTKKETLEAMFSDGEDQFEEINSMINI